MYLSLRRKKLYMWGGECVAKRGAAGYLIERQMKMKRKKEVKKRRVPNLNLMEMSTKHQEKKKQKETDSYVLLNGRC